MSDISEQKQAVEALRQNQERQARAQQIGHLGHWDWDIQGQTLVWSDEVYRVFGVDHDFRLTFENIEAMIHPDDREINNRKVQEFLATSDEIRFEFRIVRPDGDIRHIVQTAQVERDETGRATRAFGIMQDITERKQIEEALQEREVQYRRLVEGFPDIVYAFSNQRGGVYYSSQVESILGYARAHLYAHPWLWHDSIHPDDLLHIDQAIQDFAAGHPFDLEYRVQDAARGWHWFRDRSIGRREVGDEIIIEGLATDITERKQAMEALRESREQFRALAAHLQTALEAERTHIAREVHDEFGQSLTALKIDLNWLARRLPQDAPALANKIEDMTVLVDEMIQRVRRVATELRPGLLDDLGLVAALEWQAGDFARRTGLTCQIDLGDEALEQALINLDRDLSTAIFRIFQETLTNVARHAQATEVQVSLRQVQDVLILTTRDNGIGLSPDVASDPRSLGLLGMRERAQSWGGSIDFAGVAGQGTTMTLRVSVARPKEAQ